MKYRCLIDHDCKAVDHPKYLYTEGAGTHLFNTQTLLTADRVVLVEGELDAITAEQYGIPAVGYPGAGQWSSGKHKHWRWCFDSLDEVVIVADGDEPGKKSANTISDSLRDSVGAEVRVVVLPDGHDTNSFIDTYGDTAYLEELDWL